MGRKRSTRADSRLPPYVYRRRRQDVVELRRYLGHGQWGPSVCLRDEDGRTLPASATLAEISRAYHRAVQQDQGVRTLRWLLDQYLASPRFKRLAKATAGHYRGYAAAIASRKLKTGATFGDAPVDKITRPIVARYRDSRADAPIAANRELQFLSAVFSWALEQGYAKENPAQGVEKNPQKARERYVQDWEYELVLRLAPVWLQAVMELSYLCRARRGEVLALAREHLLEQGIHVKRTKGSDSEITLWSDRLRQAVALAKSHNRDVLSRLLIHDSRGGAIRAPAFNSAWQRLMKKAVAAGLKEPFPFHDIKAKGITDHTEHAGGHRSLRMRDTYVRLPDEVESTR